MVGIRSRFRYFHHLCSSSKRLSDDVKDEDTNKDFFFSLSLSISSSSSSSSVVFFSISIRMMWTMKCFSRETREILSDFILLGQMLMVFVFLSSHQLFCSLSLFSLFFFPTASSFVFVCGCPPRKLENQEKKKETKKKLDVSNE